MNGENAETTVFEEVVICGIPALFTSLRIDRRTVPDGMHLYEIRHSDEDWGEPCQLARHILINHYGSVLTSEPIQFPPDGGLDLDSETFHFSDAGFRTIPEFLEKYPSSGKDVIDFYTIDMRSEELFYSQDEEQDRKNGCVGHLRGDFGSGTEFWTTWWPHQNDRLNKEPFKGDLDRVVNWLRQDAYPLKDLQTMQKFCRGYEQCAKIPEASLPAYGFRIDTKRYQYMLRCSPARGDYNFYLYCYDKAAREQIRGLPSNSAPTPKKKLSEPER